MKMKGLYSICHSSCMMIGCYRIRWFPESSSTNWYFWPNSTFTEIGLYSEEASLLPDSIDPSWFWIVLVPLLWYLTHTVSLRGPQSCMYFTSPSLISWFVLQILYMVVENCVFGGKKYMTSYKWLTSNVKSSIHDILTLGGRVTK